MPVEDDNRDKTLETLERWKKRTIAGFALVSLLFAMTIALLVEAGTVVKVWNTVAGLETAAPDLKKH